VVSLTLGSAENPARTVRKTGYETRIIHSSLCSFARCTESEAVEAEIEPRIITVTQGSVE
jgi:hypothetical protein